MSFRTSRKFVVPRWLTEGEGGLVGYALDLLKDASMRRLELGLLARFPQQDPDGTPGPSDALVALGRDRRVVRGIFETEREYAARLTQWLVERRTAGNPFTLMRQLAAYCGPGFSFRTVDARGNWYSRDVAGVESSVLQSGTWNWDGDAARWSRFWVIVYPTSIFAAPARSWGVGVWGVTDGTIGTKATAEQITTVRGIVADWKPAGTRGEVILALDPASFNPAVAETDGTWGKFYRYAAGVAVYARNMTARYVGA